MAFKDRERLVDLQIACHHLSFVDEADSSFVGMTVVGVQVLF